MTREVAKADAFDYSSYPVADAKFIKAETTALRADQKNWSKSTFNIGERLRRIRNRFQTVKHSGAAPHSRPGWKEWLLTERYGDSTARRFIRVYERFGSRPLTGAGANLALLDYLSRDATSPAAADEVMDRIDKGEKISVSRAKEIIQPLLPTASEARKKARETNRPVDARDGFTYLGATKEQERKIQDRRKVVYTVRRSVEALAALALDVSPTDWLDSALPHQTFTHDEMDDVINAHGWLGAFIEEWEKRNGAIAA